MGWCFSYPTDEGSSNVYQLFTLVTVSAFGYAAHLTDIARGVLFMRQP
jgi:hypothetical protein